MINLRRYQNAGQTLLFISLRDRLTQLEPQVFLPAIQSELEHSPSQPRSYFGSGSPSPISTKK